MKKAKILRNLLEQREIIVAPGVYDAFSAKMVEHAGFAVSFITGAGVSASLLGEPDVGLVTMTEQVTQAAYIANAVNIPILADADTGYGNPMNVIRTVKEFERAGVAGVMIEDQEIPKRCGHLEGKRIISKSEMTQKIKAAIDSRQDIDFIIIARTDARAVHGLEAALERGYAYVEAGADMLFIESPVSLDEIRKIGGAFSLPLILNMGGKKTPNISASEAEKLGYKMIVFPGDIQRAGGKAMLDTLKFLKETGNTKSIQDRMLSFDERFELLGLKEYFKKEERFLSYDE